MSYEIKAIPTLFKGIQYRSQLEARWAMLFDFLEVDFEYEPFVLEKWAPDFVLRPGREEYLLEVKPLSEWTNEVINKIYRHSTTNKCLLFHDQIYHYPEDPKIYLGKVFEQDGSKNLVLEDIDLSAFCPIKYSKEWMDRFWKQTKNDVQFLKPV